MEEQGSILLDDDRLSVETGHLTNLGNITEMWLTDQGKLGFKTDLAYSLSIILTKADIDLLGLLIDKQAAKRQRQRKSK